jgi:hypothetical protein
MFIAQNWTAYKMKNILADLTMRGFAVNLLKLASVASPDSLVAFTSSVLT